MTSRKRVKICVYWKDESCSSWAECWIGGKGKNGNGNEIRPTKMMELLLEFLWRHNWISPAATIEHAIWWVYYKGKKLKENGFNGVEFQSKVSDDSS